MKRSMRSKKMTRRRRQKGGGTIEIKCKLLGKTTVSVVSGSTDPSITVSNPGANTLTITSTTPIKNIEFINTAPTKLAQPTKGISPAAKLGDKTGIILRDMADNKTVIPASSHVYAKAIASGATAAALQTTQKLMDMMVGTAFTAGLKVTNLNIGNLGLTGSEADFTIRITT
jgi:hypothetical protein